MRITKLCCLAFLLNGSLDTAQYQDIGLDEVSEQIDRGSIFEFLERRLVDDIDLSIFDDRDKSVLIAEWRDIGACYAPRKFAVERNGLCLLVAYLLEGIQRRQDLNPLVRAPSEKRPTVN
jgi:hypothetical protein